MMFFFKKMIEVYGYVGVTSSKTLVKHVFQNFEPFLANRSLKFQKSATVI
jgi:hypothetical protein